MENDQTNESGDDFSRKSHRVIPPNDLYDENKGDIMILLNKLAKIYNTTPEIVGKSLSRVLERL